MRSYFQLDDVSLAPLLIYSQGKHPMAPAILRKPGSAFNHWPTGDSPPNPMKNVLTLDDVRRHAPAAFTPVPAADLTPRYAHITTADVLHRLQGDGWEITAARQGRTLSEHAVHEIRLGHPEFPENGEYRVELVIENSSDGSSALRLFAGVVRFICLNGILVGDRVADVVAMHRGAVREQALELAGALRGRFQEVAGVVEHWKAIRLDRERTRAFAAEGLKLRWPDRAPAADLDEVDHSKKANCASHASLTDTPRPGTSSRRSMNPSCAPGSSG